MTKQEFTKAVAEAMASTSRKGIVYAGGAGKGLFCPTCGKQIDFSENGFSDALSIKEFFISGMCQACQDSVFVEPNGCSCGECCDDCNK